MTFIRCRGRVKVLQQLQLQQQQMNIPQLRLIPRLLHLRRRRYCEIVWVDWSCSVRTLVLQSVMRVIFQIPPIPWLHYKGRWMGLSIERIFKRHFHCILQIPPCIPPLLVEHMVNLEVMMIPNDLQFWDKPTVWQPFPIWSNENGSYQVFCMSHLNWVFHFHPPVGNGKTTPAKSNPRVK